MLNLQVLASTDDARNIDGGTSKSTNATTQHLGKFSTSDYWNGFRWNNVTIPQGATINSAVLDLYSAQVTAGTTASTIWYGVLETDTATFNTSTEYPEGKTRTTASVNKDFTVATWAATQGFGVDTFDITTLIQEIVNQGGWVSGNDLAVVAHDNGSANDNYIGHSTYDRAIDRGAKLTIDYTAGGGSPSASVSPSASASPSASVSPSASESAGVSPSSSQSPSASASAGDTVWSAQIQAWFYPGPPAENANEEYSDGRFIYTLKPEYQTLQSDGTLATLTEAGSGQNGYTAANALDVLAHCAEAFFTVSGTTGGLVSVIGNNSTSIDATKRADFISTLVSFAQTINFDGVDIDIEGYGAWDATTASRFVDLMDDLGVALHAVGLRLSVCLPPIWNDATGGPNQWDALDSQALYNITYESFNGKAVDYICILAYDYQYDWGGGTPVAPNGWVQDIITWAKSKITDNSRIIIGMPSYGYHATTEGFNVTIDTKAQSALLTGYSTATRDADSYEMTWTNGGNSYFYQDETSLYLKRKLIEAEGISRISVWHLGGNDWFFGTEPSPSPSVSPSASASPSASESPSISPSASTSPSSSASASESPSASVSPSSSPSASISFSPSASTGVSGRLDEITIIRASDDLTITKAAVSEVTAVKKGDDLTITRSADELKIVE